METLRGVVEAVETEFGEAIVARDEAVAALVNTPGLGPPDLAWLQKARKAAAPGADAGGGYYHWVLGRDVSSSAALAAYFAELTSRQEAGSWSAGEQSSWGGRATPDRP